MTQQYNIEFSRELKKAGMQKAIDTAERHSPGWSDKAYNYLVEFVKTRKEGERFLIEDVRQDAGTLVNECVHLRSWGTIAAKAIRNGIIKRVGFEKVKNHKAHQCNAAVYVRNI
jgi:hypothetical protein